MRENVKEEEIITISSKDKKIDTNKIINDIKDKKIKYILCCSNKKQITTVKQIVSKSNCYFDLYIDEIDSKFGSFKKQNFISEMEENKNIIDITLITATPLKVFESFQENNMKLKIFDLDETHSQQYHKFNDCIFNIVKNDFTLNDLYNNLINKNISVAFVPGGTRIKTHEEIRKIFVDKFYVIEINGDKNFDYKIYYKDGDVPIAHEKAGKICKDINGVFNEQAELNMELCEIVKKYCTENKRIIITGNIKINRGITISSPELMLTDSYFNPKFFKNGIKNLAKNCQTVGRLSGNFKEWKNFKPITTYCNQKFKDEMCAAEKTIIEYPMKYKECLEKHADNFSDELETNKREEEKSKYGIIYDGFIKGKNYEEIYTRYHTMCMNNKPNRIRIRKTKPKFDKNGFILQSFENVKKGDEKVYSKQELEQALKTKSFTSFLPSTGIVRKRIFWCYEDKNDKNTLVAYVKIIRIK